MVFFKKAKKSDSIRGQLGGLAKQIGIEVVGELKETGKEMLGMRKVERNSLAQNERNWADEWLKEQNQDPNKPPISDKTGGHSGLDLKEQFQKSQQQELKQVQARLNQMYSQPSSQSEYGQAKIQEKRQTNQPIYDQVWKEKQQQQQQAAKVASSPGLAATGSKRKAGDWRHGAKRKRQATPQELNRTEFRGSKGQ